MPLLAALAVASLVAALVAMASPSPPVNYYLLPVGDPRCRNAASQLRCLDQSVLLVASDAPDESLLDSYLLCNSTWAALGCQQEDVGAVTWRLAFRLTAVPCGHRVLFVDSPVNPLQRPPWLQYETAESESNSAASAAAAAAAAARLVAAGVVSEFTCKSHSYPYVHRPAYRFTRLTWHRDPASSASASAAASPVAINITAHVYAQFRSGLSAADRAAECDWRGGFRCRGQQQRQLPQLLRNESSNRPLFAGGGGGGGGETCVYGTHRCNGHDDCLDAPAVAAPASAVRDATGDGNATTTGSAAAAAAALVSSDELDCSYGGASGLFNFWPHGSAAAAAHPPSSAAAAVTAAAFPAACCLLLMRC